jgi:hypothetical protein
VELLRKIPSHVLTAYCASIHRIKYEPNPDNPYASLSCAIQSYFRETPYPGVLLQLLLFPPQLQFGQPAPQEFALQFWDKQKTKNVSLVIGLVGMMVGVKGGNVCYTTSQLGGS